MAGSITNTPKLTDDVAINKLRGAVMHRAQWMGLILEEAKARGLDWVEIGHAAVHATGEMHGEAIKGHMQTADSLVDFADTFLTEDIRKIFEIDIKQSDENVLSVEFGYCPLVAGWMQAGIETDMIPKLCDIAMSGDRGICGRFDQFEFHLGKTIADGEPTCEVAFTRKK